MPDYLHLYTEIDNFLSIFISCLSIYLCIIYLSLLISILFWECAVCKRILFSNLYYENHMKGYHNKQKQAISTNLPHPVLPITPVLFAIRFAYHHVSLWWYRGVWQVGKMQSIQSKLQSLFAIYAASEVPYRYVWTRILIMNFFLWIFMIISEAS